MWRQLEDCAIRVKGCLCLRWHRRRLGRSVGQSVGQLVRGLSDRNRERKRERDREREREIDRQTDRQKWSLATLRDMCKVMYMYHVMFYDVLLWLIRRLNKQSSSIC